MNHKSAMQTIRKITTGLILMALLAIGSFGFAAQSDSVQLSPQTAHAEVETSSDPQCTMGEERSCFLWWCNCQGLTTHFCQGDAECLEQGDEPVRQ